MVGINVIQLVWPLAKVLPFGPSTNPTEYGVVPWAIALSGVSFPLVKIGTILSTSLNSNAGHTRP